MTKYIEAIEVTFNEFKEVMTINDLTYQQLLDEYFRFCDIMYGISKVFIRDNNISNVDKVVLNTEIANLMDELKKLVA